MLGVPILCINIADEPFSVGDEEFYDIDFSGRDAGVNVLSI